MSLDLHIHSTYSDGTMTPAELVEMAKARGLEAIAITDHDTMEGVNEAVLHGKKVGLEVIPGIEVSAVHKGVYVHILGYFLRPDDLGMKEKLLRVQNARAERNIKILARLQQLGMKIVMDDLARLSGQGQAGRPHIAQLMVQKGFVTSINEAFTLFLARGKTAYVSRFVYSAVKAIEMIKKAGGFAVLAHPVLIDPSCLKTKIIVRELASEGLAGIEVYYPSQNKKIRKKLRALAEEYDLVLTGGSDYHGDVRPNTTLAGGKNVHVPPELLDQMKEKLLLIQKNI